MLQHHRLLEHGCGEVERDPGRVTAGADDPNGCLQLARPGARAIEDVARHAAIAIAAGVGDGAVRVMHHHRSPQSLAGRDDDDAVRADSRPAVAERSHTRRSQILRAFDQHKVIAAAVHLHERGGQCTASSTRGSGSPCVGSYQVMSGSRRNQVICRRAYATVSRTVRATASSSESAPLRCAAQCT